MQLSSPVEEATLTDIFDVDAEEIPSSMKVLFRGVETAQATLTISVIDADSMLGSSEPLDVAPIAKFDPLSSVIEHESEVTVSVKGNDDEGESDPACSVTLRLTFVASAAEKREQLYELLSVATKKKASVMEKLRQVSMNAAAASQQVAPRSNNSAVKAGFLNKPKQEEFKLQAWYDAYLGPNSLVRRAFPIMKNYIIFCGVVGFLHFQGHVLALPPPV